MSRLWFASALLILVACSRSGSTEAGPTTTPKWVASASRAPAPMAKLALDSQTKPEWPNRRAETDAILDDAAAAPATADGIKQAAAILNDGRSKLRDPKWTGSGTAPWATWLHHAGLAILADLAQRACKAKDADAAVVAAIDAIDLPPVFTSGGVDQARVERDRNDLRRAASGCGAKPKD